MLPAALVAAAAAGAAWAVRGRSSPFFGPVIWHGDRSVPAVALTFDDGPSTGTPELLHTLCDLEVPATFFVCGAAAQRHPEIVRQALAGGHEIGSHGYSHSRLWLRRPAEVFAEIDAAQSAITAVTGAPPRLYRPAYGVRWPGAGEAVRAHGLTTVMWSILAGDWALDAGATAGRVLRRVRNGDIICLHDGREADPAPDVSNTIAAVRTIVPALRGRGLAFRTVSQLCLTTSTHA